MKRFFVMSILLSAVAVHAAEERGPAVRQGGQIGEQRTFIATSLSNTGTLVFTAPPTGWFTIIEVCGNTDKANRGDINVSIFAGDLHIATLLEEEGGEQPKCIEFAGGLVLPRNVGLFCEGASNQQCWISGVCNRDCTIP